MSKKYLYVILVVFISIACQRPTNKLIIDSDDETDPSLLIDSSLIKVNKRYRHNIIKYTYYNSEDTTRIDSIKLYYADTKTLASVEYRPKFETAPDKWVNIINYNSEEKIQYILYDYKNPRIGDTIKIQWRPTGPLWIITTYARDSINYPFLYESFHENGVLAEKGIYDEYHSPIVRTGLWQYYDSTGVLTKTKDFVYPKKKRAYWVESEYYKNGQLKSEKQYYYDLEGVSDVIEPKGTWKYYDKQGNITKMEKRSEP